nr:Ger(x)C family spore germination protein [Caldicoprobacter guelmensis]
MTGCWDNVDLIDINIVTALGIDKSEDGKIIVTVQVIEPAALQSTSSSQGKGGMAQPKPVFVKSYKGETISDALISMKAVVDKRLFLSTLQVIILGEKLCREGINEALDFLHRDYQVEYLADVLVARGCSPEDILKIQPEMDAIPAMYIKGTIENTKLRAKVKRTMLIELFKDVKNKCRQITIGQITKENEKTVKAEGTAVFKDGKLVGWLNQYETRGFLFATDKVESTVVTIPVASGKMSIQVLNSNGKIDVKFKNGQPYRLSIYVNLEGNIAEYTGKGVLSFQQDIHMLQKALSEEVKKEIAMAIRKAQKEYSSDIFGFGKIVHKYHPQYWKQIMDQWNDIFSQLPVDIVVNLKIRRSGLIKSPMIKDE